MASAEGQFADFTDTFQISPEPVVVNCDDGTRIEITSPEFEHPVATDTVCEAVSDDLQGSGDQTIEPLVGLGIAAGSLIAFGTATAVIAHKVRNDRS